MGFFGKFFGFIYGQFFGGQGAAQAPARSLGYIFQRPQAKAVFRSLVNAPAHQSEATFISYPPRPTTAAMVDENTLSLEEAEEILLFAAVGAFD